MLKLSAVLDQLPAFCTSQMAENRQLLNSIDLGLSKMIEFIALFQFVCAGLFVIVNVSWLVVLMGCVIQLWREWMTIAKILIKAELMRSSQISWKVFTCHFLAVQLGNFVGVDGEWFDEIVKWQIRFLKWLMIDAQSEESTESMRSLPRIAGEWEQADNLVYKTLNAHFPLALTKITEEYKVLSQKVDLLTTDLEDYFNSSCAIELRLFYDAENYRYHLRILNRGDRLLLTCPTSIVRRDCYHPNLHNDICSCKYSTKIFCDDDQCKRQPLLLKNLIFFRWLWEKINGRWISELSIEGKLDVCVKPEMHWKNSMSKEFNIATFVVDDILFTSQMNYCESGTLQFVGVE